MQPIGPLMREHRLIERMVAGVGHSLSLFREEGRVDAAYVQAAADFIHTYADRCHHGKEEDILFRELAKKDLAPRFRILLEELVQEHAWARRATKRLAEANTAVAWGAEDRLDEVLTTLGQLLSFYPGHITKEESRFFRPAMALLREEEQLAILKEFAAFEQILIHEKYRLVVEELSRGHEY